MASMQAVTRVNVSDDMLRALAGNRGVIGISFGEGFINPKDAEALRSATESESIATDLTGKPWTRTLSPTFRSFWERGLR